MLNESLDRLTAYASVRSRGGINVFSGRATISAETVPEYLSTPDDKRSAIDNLQQKGFEVERVGPLSVRISGPAELFEKQMGAAFERQELEDNASRTVSPLWVPTVDTTANLLDTGISELEGIAFPKPVTLHAPSSTPPALRYYHLKVPDDVVRILNADPVHADGVRGRGVRTAMIDSGFHWSHTYFASRRYDLEVSLPAGSDNDANGHGTGESANLLAIAPETNLYGLAMVDIIRAVQVARDNLGVQVISNSWGSRADTDGPNGFWDPYWTLVQAEIALCVREGIIVLFSGGNGGMSFTASMPETISVGGVYVDEEGEMQASDYASSFDSTRFPGQHVPEVCGLTGMQPEAIYIALPIPPGCEIDRDLSGLSFPDKDETDAEDGWGVFSGTSAACPMVAGTVALILCKYPGADLEEVRERLRRAQDVTEGHSSMGDSAGPDYDSATGHGLVNVEQACI
jgi:subtilisin family serine protease